MGALQTKYAAFESKNAFEPVGKVLIRWLDRNILSVFVAGLKRTKLVKEVSQFLSYHIGTPSLIIFGKTSSFIHSARYHNISGRSSWNSPRCPTC